MENTRRELRLKGIPSNTKEELFNIAANLGVTVSGLMKSKIRAIIESYPADLRRPRAND